MASSLQARMLSTEAKAASTGPIGLKSLGAMLLAGGGLVYYYLYQKERMIQDMIAKDSASVGVASIGGPFELIDHNGRPFSDKDLEGKFSLLYFGFTHCPDICPEELEKVAAAVDLLEKQGVEVNSVFVSVDPHRDGVPQVREYVQEFHPKLIGLTGPPDKVEAMAKAYRVYYMKSTDEDDDYLLDHSIITYLFNPEGQFVTFYGKNFEAEDMAKSIAGHTANWDKQHKQEA